MKRLLTSCFGLGWLPIAPGSWGSLPSAIIFGLVYYLGGSGVLAMSLMVALIAAGSFVCVKFSHVAVAATGNEDPNEVVADEIAGQALTFLAMPLLMTNVSGGQIVSIAVLGYFLFRLFDTVKPWPSHRLEELPAGWGILADDLMAGVYAGIALFVSAKIWILK
ncbi:MAG: phosphatidylglycerophosphatase A [Sedimentisphaerales bacterium]|jgi:phosphatidylglycerophosphatase A